MAIIDERAAWETAERAARAAGDEIRKWIGRPRQTAAKSSACDLVTEVDKACQEIIRETLSAAFPASQMLGEESVAPGSEAAARAVTEARREFLWVVDPIDGTLNFIRGIPACTVSIGLMIDDQPVIGVVYDPMRDEMFGGRAGHGAYLNGTMIRVSPEPRLEHAVLASGFPPGGYRGRNAGQIMRLGRHVSSVRAFGSAALHLAYVAAGRVDGFWENDLNAWDLCGGVVLVLAAGGRATDAHGSPYQLGTRHIVATNGHIHEELLRELRVDELPAP